MYLPNHHWIVEGISMIRIVHVKPNTCPNSISLDGCEVDVCHEVETWDIPVIIDNSQMFNGARVSNAQLQETPSAETKEENQAGQGLLYPNPVVDGKLLINKTATNSSASIKIINSNGNAVYEQNYTESIDVHALPPGIYTLILMDGKNTKQERFIKK